jgi:hypothetical protein
MAAILALRISGVLAAQRTVARMEDEYLPAIRVESRPLPISLRGLRVSARTAERLLYAGAAVSYVAIGVFVNEFTLSWVVGIGWLLLWVWGLPALWQAVRR